MQHATNRITISFVLIYPALFRLIPWFPTFCVLRGRQQITNIALTRFDMLMQKIRRYKNSGFCADVNKLPASRKANRVLTASGGFFREVTGVQAVILALLCYKLVVRATLDNSALLKHHNTIGVAHG